MKINLAVILFVLTVFLLSCNRIELETPVVADFSIDSADLYIGDTVQFNNLCENINGKNDSANFQWHFEGGIPETSNLAAPKVVYLQPGSFSVKLFVSGKTFLDSLIKQDFIKIQGMFAGELGGIDVKYKVFDQTKEPFDSIDINEDGTYDIQFELNSTCCRYRYEQIFAKGLNDTRISVNESSANAKKHQKGDIITPKLTWSDDYLCINGISQVTQGPNTIYDSCGEFVTYGQDNYLCFNINDKAFGWINISANASFFGSSMRIKDYAYTMKTQNKK